MYLSRRRIEDSVRSRRAETASRASRSAECLGNMRSGSRSADEEARGGRRDGGYNSAVPPVSLSLDTSPEIERLQVEGWQHMSPAQKAAVVSGLTQAVHDLALAGVRLRHPQASEREQFLRLALITLGVDLARRAYPEIATTNLA